MTKLEQTTNELLERLPRRCKYSIDNLKYDYNTFTDRDSRYDTQNKATYYLFALEDVGTITEYERTVLAQYIFSEGGDKNE